MRIPLRFGMFLVCLTLPLTMITSCGQQDRVRTNSVPPSGNTPVKTEAITESNGTTWVPLKLVAQSLGLRLQENMDSANLGYTDVMFTVQPSRRHATSFGQPITLPQAPVRENGQLYITMDAVSALLQTKAKIDSRTGKLNFDRITPANDNMPPQTGTSRFGVLSVAEHKDEIVAYAKQFLGVPYEFGAAPYEQSKTFDCSSFTRHVFKKFGKDLPRLARDQAKEGVPVTRDELQAGDLIFFTVPGRFQSDKIPGHVGIYIGNGKFIHTWGEPGVQISPLDSGYWSRVMLSMRRIR